VSSPASPSTGVSLFNDPVAPPSILLFRASLSDNRIEGGGHKDEDGEATTPAGRLFDLVLTSEFGSEDGRTLCDGGRLFGVGGCFAPEPAREQLFAEGRL